MIWRVSMVTPSTCLRIVLFIAVFGISLVHGDENANGTIVTYRGAKRSSHRAIVLISIPKSINVCRRKSHIIEKTDYD